jgi:putative ABC transport system substrate-binding protein
MRPVGRRAFLLSGGAALAAPFVAGAQLGARIWRVGILRPAPDDAVFRQNFVPFLQALKERRFSEGANLALEYRVRPGNAEEMLSLANDLVRARVDALLAIAPAGVSAAAKATSSIPIVAIDLESDPIAQGFAVSLSRPQRNITGVFLDFPDLGAKWIELLKETVPGVARVAILWDPTTGTTLLNAATWAASSLGLEVFRFEARAPADFEHAFASAAKQKAGALLALGSPVFNSARKQVADLALKHRLPALMPFPGFADDGGLIAHGPHLTTLFRQAGLVMAKVLQGARPGELPIERPARFELVVNLRTARALGIAPSPAALLRADRVIE